MQYIPHSHDIALVESARFKWAIRDRKRDNKGQRAMLRYGVFNSMAIGSRLARSEGDDTERTLQVSVPKDIRSRKCYYVQRESTGSLRYQVGEGNLAPSLRGRACECLDVHVESATGYERKGVRPSIHTQPRYLLRTADSLTTKTVSPRHKMAIAETERYWLPPLLPQYTRVPGGCCMIDTPPS